MNSIVVYTDGGCRQNGKTNNIGGWGVVLEYKEHTKEIKGAMGNTTNNEMELTAVIKALETIKTNTIPVIVHSDSAYVIGGIGGKKPWIHNWIKNNWLTSTKKPVVNKELWVRLSELVQQFDSIEFVKVKGHSDNVGNNRADELVNIAMDNLKL